MSVGDFRVRRTLKKNSHVPPRFLDGVKISVNNAIEILGHDSTDFTELLKIKRPTLTILAGYHQFA